MDNKSSIQKGNELEKSAFELLTELLDNENFFVSGKKSKIFWKKPYFSEKRKGNIIFDITIETFLDGVDKYSLLTIFECKNLKKSVSVDDVEEFSSKISQIGEHNTKGVLITTSHFQKRAFEYAVSQKIALVKLVSNDKFEWINYRKERSSNLLADTDLKTQFLSDEFSTEKFIASINNKMVFNFADLLIESQIIDLFIHNETFIDIPYVTENKIDEIVTRLIKHNVYCGCKLDTEKLCKFLSEVYPITFDFNNTLQDNLLGKIEFNPLKITISKNISDKNRWRFTLAHEIGHLVLHHSVLKDKLTEKTDNEFSIDLRNLLTNKTHYRMELQANLFASHLLLPIISLKYLVAIYFVENKIQKGFLYLDYQKCNRDLVFPLLNKISSEYGVSLEVAKIRLIELSILRDNTDMSLKKMLRQILK